MITYIETEIYMRVLILFLIAFYQTFYFFKIYVNLSYTWNSFDFIEKDVYISK